MTSPGLLPPVEVVAVRPVHDERIAAHGINFPPAESSNDFYAFKAIGWVLGKSRQVVAVELVHEGRVLRRRPMQPRPDVAEKYSGIEGSENSGFWLTAGVLGLPPQCQLELWAVLADNDRVRFADFTVVHRPVWTSYKPRLQPLMVTSIGRTGTTWLMRLISEHPQVVVHRAYPHELRIARYWMHMLKVLTEPADAQHSSHPDRFPVEPSFIGHNPYYGAYLAGQGPLMRWLGRDYLERLAAFVMQSIDDFYEKVAVDQRCDRALFFAEKALPDHLAQMAWEMYPEGREVFLVRDPRDILCSVLAFNQKRGYVAFGRQDVGDDAAYVDLLAQTLATLAEAWQARQSRSVLVRYEDLILDPMTALTAVVRYAGLDTTPKLLAGMVERASLETPEFTNHRTAGDPASSLGRWRTDLTAELIDLSSKAFGPFLKKFGYSELPKAKQTKEEAARVAP